MKSLSRQECIDETMAHIGHVRSYLNQVVSDLIDRSVVHDASKLEQPELDVFRQYTPLLRKAKYLSAEYNQFLVDMKEALDHHYKHTKHHPQSYPEGWRGMNLLDLLEMVCDWMASVRRNDGGNIYDSLEGNKERFDISDDMMKILRNTVDYIEALLKEEEREDEVDLVI